jgi:hypothetical protein
MKINPKQNRRILVIDDNRAIHEDFRKIVALKKGQSSNLRPSGKIHTKGVLAQQQGSASGICEADLDEKSVAGGKPSLLPSLHLW